MLWLNDMVSTPAGESQARISGSRGTSHPGEKGQPDQVRPAKVLGEVGMTIHDGAKKIFGMAGFRAQDQHESIAQKDGIRTPRYSSPCGRSPSAMPSLSPGES